MMNKHIQLELFADNKKTLESYAEWLYNRQCELLGHELITLKSIERMLKHAPCGWKNCNIVDDLDSTWHGIIIDCDISELRNI